MITTSTSAPLEFDSPAIPCPTKVSTAVARLSPLALKECGLVSRRVENGFLTDDEERQLAEVYAALAKEDAEREARCLHPDRKTNYHDA